jgi:hypothetical protein
MGRASRNVDINSDARYFQRPTTVLLVLFPELGDKNKVRYGCITGALGHFHCSYFTFSPVHAQHNNKDKWRTDHQASILCMYVCSFQHAVIHLFLVLSCKEKTTNKHAGD